MGSKSPAEAEILIADSEIEDGKRAASLLEKAGCTKVRLASSQRECLELIANWQPTLMLVDLRLDGMTGISKKCFLPSNL